MLGLRCYQRAAKLAHVHGHLGEHGRTMPPTEDSNMNTDGGRGLNFRDLAGFPGSAWYAWKCTAGLNEQALGTRGSWLCCLHAELQCAMLTGALALKE